MKMRLASRQTAQGSGDGHGEGSARRRKLSSTVQPQDGAKEMEHGLAQPWQKG